MKIRSWIVVAAVLVALTVGATAHAQTAEFTIGYTPVRTSLPFSDPGYTANGSFTVSVTDVGTCVGTYTVNATPIAASGPGGSTPPFTTVTTYIGFPDGFPFLFANAGVGSYTVTVTQTGGGCVGAVSPKQLVAVVEQAAVGDYTVAVVTTPSQAFYNYGTVSVTVTGTGGCVGTFDLLLTPVPGSGPQGANPPATSPTSYTNVPAGTYTFSQAGAGAYTVTVDETSGDCTPAVDPQTQTAVVAELAAAIPALDGIGLGALALLLAVSGFVLAGRRLG